jgi:hypothetical protein
MPSSWLIVIARSARAALRRRRDWAEREEGGGRLRIALQQIEQALAQALHGVPGERHRAGRNQVGSED